MEFDPQEVDMNRPPPIRHRSVSTRCGLSSAPAACPWRFRSRCFSRRGFILGLVLIFLVIILIGLFGYHRMVRSRTLNALKVSEGAVTATLAREGLTFLGNVIRVSPLFQGEELKNNTLPDLFQPDCPETVTFAAGFCTPDGKPSNPSYWLDRVAADFQKCLLSLDGVRSGTGRGRGQQPVCERMEVVLKRVTSLQPRPATPLDLAAGWNPLEKKGEMILSCKVRYLGVTRVAMTVRQFKLISFIPGPYARFSLFAQHAPSADCYNVVRNTYAGPPDGRGSGPVFRPLVIYNSTAPLPGAGAPSTPSAQQELQTKGWVYPGQSPVGTWDRRPESLKGLVRLRLPSGYKPDPRDPAGEDLPLSFQATGAGVGAHVYLSPPTALANGKAGVYPYPVPAAGLFNPVAAGGPYNVHLRFQGFFTQDPTVSGGNNQGAADFGLWADDRGPLQAKDCTSSWLLPFGDRRHPSRTLVFGPTMIEFLQFYTLQTPGGKAIIRAVPDPTAYDPAAPVQTLPPLSGAPRADDLFLPRPEDPPGKPGWKSWRMVSPRIVQARSVPPACHGVAANLVFDMLVHQQLPDLNRSLSTAD